MTIKVVIRARAYAEIRHARDTYFAISPELGRRFRRSIRERIARIAERPQMYPRVHGEIRRTITSDFPYSMFYVKEPQAIVVLRLIHHAQDSSTWPDGV